MTIDVGKEVVTLKRQTVARLRDRYAEVFGEATTTGNKTWLVRRIAWRLQALAEGDPTERPKALSAEPARDAGLRIEVRPANDPSRALRYRVRGEPPASSHGRLVRFRIDLGQERPHRRTESLGELLGHEDGRHPLPALQQADVRPVKPGRGRQRLLRECGGQPLAADDAAELALQLVHGARGCRKW